MTRTDSSLQARVEISRRETGLFFTWHARVTASQWEESMWCMTERSACRWASRSARRAARAKQRRGDQYTYRIGAR